MNKIWENFEIIEKYSMSVVWATFQNGKAKKLFSPNSKTGKV
jgi:hypothetical protein